jgi:hypothetical protein
MNPINFTNARDPPKLFMAHLSSIESKSRFECCSNAMAWILIGPLPFMNGLLIVERVQDGYALSSSSDTRHAEDADTPIRRHADLIRNKLVFHLRQK